MEVYFVLINGVKSVAVINQFCGDRKKGVNRENSELHGWPFRNEMKKK